MAERTPEEIAAGLMLSQRITLDNMRKWGAVMAGETQSLSRDGLAYAHGDGTYRLTPLGRRVAAVLRGEADDA